jgi:CBS domain containing-hemolysin-like protein
LSEHEYSVVDHSRSKNGMYIAFCAGTIAGALAVGAGLLMTVVCDAGYLSLPAIVFWPVTGAAVFGIMFLCSTCLGGVGGEFAPQLAFRMFLERGCSRVFGCFCIKFVEG